jgi:predicted DNA-binding transcriptional regulator AlpA
MKKRLLSEIEVEKVYGLNRFTQRRYRAKKEIPFIKLKGRVYYSTETLEAWIKSHEVEVRQAN